MFKKIFSLFCILLLTSTSVFAQDVVYNVKTGKYHKPSCVHAVRCTQNCIKIEKSKALQRGGKACKSCGG